MSGRRGARSTRSRFERRAAQVRRRPHLLFGAVMGLLLVLVALVWVVGFSSVLAVRSVRVLGVSPAEQDRVRSVAMVPVGRPLARLDARTIEARVRQIPWVQTVSVSRSWPSTVTINTIPRVPVLAIRNPQGQLQVVDTAGIAYQTVEQLPPGVALVNAGPTPPAAEGLRAAVTALGLLAPAQRAAVKEVSVSGANLVTFSLGKVTVIWGGGYDGEKKLKVLNALLATNAGVIDVSAPGTPVTR